MDSIALEHSRTKERWLKGFSFKHSRCKCSHICRKANLPGSGYTQGEGQQDRQCTSQRRSSDR